MAGAKELLGDVINIMSIKGTAQPALIVKKLTDVYNVIEDTYSVEDTDELQQAIDDIGSGAGTIFLEAGTMVISATIDIDQGGSIIFRGHGVNTILKPNAGIKVFNITDTSSLVFEHFSVNTSNYASDISVFDVSEASNNHVGFKNITITGGSQFGKGIEINSEIVVVESCRIDGMENAIYVTSDNNYLNGNVITGCVNGIYLTGASDNRISGNDLTGNDSNTANPQAAIYLTTASSDNTINANNVENNNNAGAGTTYGIYIATSNCSENSIFTNDISGNDEDLEDEGVKTEIIYYCSTETQINNAIASIGTKAGTIKLLNGTITLTAVINVDGGGNYLIEGQGDGTIIDINGDWKAFNITSATSCILRNFKIDAIDLTTESREVIDITEASNNPIIIEQITIVGDGTNGYGIELNSQFIIIRNCILKDLARYISLQVTANSKIINNYFISSIAVANKYGITSATTDGGLITGNHFSGFSTDQYAIFASANYMTITGNIFDDCYNGIYLSGDYNVISSNTFLGIGYITITLTNGATYNTVIGNSINNNDVNTAAGWYGVWAEGDNNSILSNTICNNNNAGAGTTYGIFIHADADSTFIAANQVTGNDTNILNSGTNTIFENISVHGYLRFEKWVSVTASEVNVDVIEEWDSTERAIVLDINATGVTASCLIICQYIIGDDFTSFANLSNDIVIRAKQDAGADIDCTITINFVDASGTDSDDDSVNATALTNAWATYDCAINAGSFSAGDKVSVQIAIALPDADDEVKITISNVKYD